MKYRNQLLAIAGLLFVFSCTTLENKEQDLRFGFVTQLGSDTLAIENIVASPNEIQASVLLLSPEVRRAEYTLTLVDEKFETLNTQWYRMDSLMYVEEYNIDGDTLRWLRTSGETKRDGAQKVVPGMLPFIDMVHWPFELMLNQLESDTSHVRVFSGRRGFDFKAWKTGNEEAIIKHPTRGEMDVKINESGQLVYLNASRTTRALTVNRTEAQDIVSLESRFLAIEKSGKKFGALSGRGEGSFSLSSAAIKLDYGTPQKRNRDIWGGLIKYGKLWRTGANRATHFTTDSDLLVGDLEVPAGEYTFFSIPAAEELVLIINTQTGQNGQTYNESLDLGRLSMKYRESEELVEVFTIDVVEESESYLLRLRWDGGEYVAPVSVAGGK